MTFGTNTVQLTESLPVAIGNHWTKRAGLIAALVATDMFTVLLGFWLAYLIRFETGVSWFYQHETLTTLHDFYQQFVFFLMPVWVVVFAVFGLYDLKNLFAGTKEYSLVFNAGTLGIMLVILFTFFEPELVVARAWVLLSWVLVILCVGLGRFAFRRVVHQLRHHGNFMTPVLIVGANEEGRAIARQFQDNPNAGIKVMGFVDDTVNVDIDPVTDISILGSPKSIIRLARLNNVREVIVASTALTRNDLLALVESLHGADISIRLSSGLYELLTTGVEVQEVGNVPLLSINKVRLTGSDMVMKRMLDLVGSFVALLLLSPVMLAVAIAIKLDSRGPVIYRRRVVGVGGKTFDAFKFRTMVIDADARLAQDITLRKQFEKNYKLKDDPRVTRIGRFLRRTSLDELPQLLNVFLGQMSLVGPRMITERELMYYGKWGMNLSTVKPGITGLWQVSGRSDVSYGERVRLDMNYIRNYSIWMDLYLLWQTVPAVLKSRGAY